MKLLVQIYHSLHPNLLQLLVIISIVGGSYVLKHTFANTYLSEYNFPGQKQQTVIVS